ncbi:MAG: DUF2147 domain-containing protein [Erythrobacter sp.]|jgi:uncharacterized protein (DUF2147 family)|nr:DUF2147 domain-containing protein [Erythrobacter sp.]
MNRLLALLALLPTVVLATPASAADPIAGRWLTEGRDAVIEVGDCGKSVCGKIARFLVPPPDGADQRDVNNPDPKLRRRKLLGLPVLYGFDEEEDLWRGRIYDPKSGKSYRSVIRRKGRDRLEVKGCVAFICQTQVWIRAR